MYKGIKKLQILTILVLSVSLFTGCSGLDVIGNYAIISAQELLKVKSLGLKEAKEQNFYQITAPDQTTEFIWTKDSALTWDYDVAMVTDVTPFLEAGLQPELLQNAVVIDEKLVISRELGTAEYKKDSALNGQMAFEQLILNYREQLSYHEAMDHFGLDLGYGNKLEWAKDFTSNDKDFVLILDPEFLQNAGVLVDQVQGWTYASVEVMDEKGKTVEVMKLLKAFNLEEGE